MTELIIFSISIVNFKPNCLVLFIFLISSLYQSNASFSNYSENTKNVSVMAKETAHLRCQLNMDDIGDNLVMWIRKSDNHILTVGFYKYISDPRISTSYHNNQWILQIKDVNPEDTGLYECRISSNSGVLVSNPTIRFMLNINDSNLNQNEVKDILNFLNLKSNEKNNQIQEIIERAEDLLKKAEDKTGSLDPAVIVNEFLADPFPVKNFNISDSGGLTYFDGYLRNMSIQGLKRLEIRNMKFNLGLMQLKVIMELPAVRLEGIYDLNGKVTFIPFYGNGNFWMNVSGLEIHAYGALNRSESNKVQVGSIELDVKASDINLNFENLMGSWSGFTNTLLNQISSLIFNEVKHSMLDEVSHDIKTMINQQLSHLPLDFVNEKSSNVFDDILEYSKKAINDSGLDPLELPPFNDKFNYNMLVFVLEGQIRVFEGRLYGLSTLMRTGDIIADYRNNEVTFEASLGFANLTGGYKWATNLMGGGPSGSASISMSSFSCYLKVKQSLKKGMRPTIVAFKIEQIKHLWIDVDGLGSWDFILEIVMNLVSNAFKLSLANAISGPVTHAIQKELNNLPISFL